MRFHLEQLDHRSAARNRAAALEQRLLLDRLELEVLGERVDEILVRHGRRQLLLADRAVEERAERRFQAPPLGSQDIAILIRQRLVDEVDQGAAVEPVVSGVFLAQYQTNLSRPRRIRLNRPSSNRSKCVITPVQPIA